ncbi:PepSY domain-containing protein [Psychrobacter sp. DWR1-2-3]|uniref:PepSY domain-containing protein n=1 Tax=Psychrobacter sp. DWR1-2-3 TaxID=2804637 RepID=UPI003CEAEA96
MKILPAFSFKTAISAGLALTMLGTVAGCAVVGSGYEDYPIYGGNSDYGNVDYKRVNQTLRNDLRRKGYQVMDIRADNYRGNRAITAIARKNNQTYELKYTYPDLRLISSNKRASTSIWQDDRYDKNDYKKDKYKNNKHYKNDDIEDSIKRDSRYPAIKQRAINKVRSMGYRVEDIELKEKNGRGVFEIEAKRGSQEYEIFLDYPNLNVIKIKKD